MIYVIFNRLIFTYEKKILFINYNNFQDSYNSKWQIA